MAQVLRGYAYSISKDKDGMRLANAKAFDPDYITPVTKDHPSRSGHEVKRVGQIIGKEHDALGLLVEVLVYDDNLAGSVVGFSIGTKRLAYAKQMSGMPLEELSLCVDDAPRNGDCTIKSRRPADPMDFKFAQLALDVARYGVLTKQARELTDMLAEMAADQR